MQNFSSCVRWCVCLRAGVFVARCANFDKVYIIIIAESSCRSCCTSGIICPRVCLRELKCNYVVGQTQKA